VHRQFLKALSAVGALLASGELAIAQSICNAAYPTRATGAACSGPNAVGHITRPDGLVVCCIGSYRAASPNRGRVSIPSNISAGGDRYAAGLQLGVAGLSLIIELINLFGPSMAGDSSGDIVREQERVRSELQEERRQAHRDAARWHEAGMREVKKGDMRSAEGFLIKAARLAEASTDFALRDRYERELNVVKATQHMKEGLAFQAEGKIAYAALELNKAAYFAELTGRPDLSQRIRDYRRNLIANQSNGTKPQKAPKITEKSTCLEVNGKMICE
jgi:hypothetical protein